MTTDPDSRQRDAARAYFQRSADAFDRLYRERDQGRIMRWLNRRFRSDIARRHQMALQHAEAIGAESVLDVGCGAGRYLASLAERGVRRLVGIDMSAAMLELARRRLADLDEARFELIRTEFMTWSTDERFDIVIAMGFFDYQAAAGPVLAKMRALAKHSVMASFPGRHWFRTPLRQVRYRFKRCPVFFYRQDQILSLSREAGFSRVHIAAIPGGGMDHVATFWT